MKMRGRQAAMVWRSAKQGRALFLAVFVAVGAGALALAAWTEYRELAAIAQVMESNLESIRKNFLAEPRGGGSGSGSGGAPRRPSAPSDKPTRKRVPEVRLKLEPPDPSLGPSSW